MEKQEIFDKISTIDTGSIQDESIRNIVTLLLNSIEILQQENLELKKIIQTQRDEINKLKGEQGKPDIKPNTKSTSKDISTQGKERKKKKHNKQAKKKHIEIHQTIEVTLNKEELPQDTTFKYWQDVIAQDIVFEVKNTCYKVAVYHSVSLGKTFRAKLPEGASYHSKNLEIFIITLNKVLDVTEAKILTLLKSMGVEISKGSLSTILLKYTAIAKAEKQEILKAGLASSYVQTDSTGTRVCGKNKYSNIITNPLFTSYTTTLGKSHLDVLAAFQGLDNKEKLNLRYDDIGIKNLKNARISKRDMQELNRVLKNNQVITLSDFIKYIKQKIPDLYHKKNIFIKVKSALAMAYYRYQDEIPKVDCLVSDNAPEYNHISIEHQALCWVHDARYYKKLQPVLEIHRKKLTDFIKQYWEFYNELLDYKETPSPKLADKINDCFDTLFTTKTDYFQLDMLIAKTFKNKNKLLVVLL